MTNLHKDLTDPELHEAKGAAAAATNTVLTATGLGTATFQTNSGIQNLFGTVTGNTGATVAADSPTDNLTIVGEDGVTTVTDAATDKVTIKGIPGPVNSLAAGDVSDQGTTGSFANADHTHGVPAGTPSNVSFVDNTPGTSSEFVHKDHKHKLDIIDATPGTVTNGDQFLFADSSDGNKVKRSAVGDILENQNLFESVTGNTGATVTAGSPTDVLSIVGEDGITTSTAAATDTVTIKAIPGPVNSLLVGDTSDQGTTGSLANANHAHGVPAGTPSDVSFAGNIPGTSTDFVHRDHQHDLPIIQATAATISSADSILFADADDGDKVKRGLVSGIPVATDKRVIPARVDWDKGEGNPSVVDSGDLQVFEFTSGSIKGVNGDYPLDSVVDLSSNPDLVSFFVVTQVGSTDADIKMQLDVQYIAVGELSTKVDDEVLTAVVSVINIDDRMHSFTFSLDRTKMAASDLINFNLKRDGVDVDDTFDGRIGIVEHSSLEIVR